MSHNGQGFNDQLNKMEKPVCSKCGKKFQDVETMNKHMNAHFSPRRYPCERCGKKFANVISLAGHRRRCIKEETSQNSSNLMENTKEHGSDVHKPKQKIVVDKDERQSETGFDISQTGKLAEPPSSACSHDNKKTPCKATIPGPPEAQSEKFSDAESRGETSCKFTPVHFGTSPIIKFTIASRPGEVQNCGSDKSVALPDDVNNTNNNSQKNKTTQIFHYSQVQCETQQVMRPVEAPDGSQHENSQAEQSRSRYKACEAAKSVGAARNDLGNIQNYRGEKSIGLSNDTKKKGKNLRKRTAAEISLFNSMRHETLEMARSIKQACTEQVKNYDDATTIGAENLQKQKTANESLSTSKENRDCDAAKSAIPALADHDYVKNCHGDTSIAFSNNTQKKGKNLRKRTAAEISRSTSMRRETLRMVKSVAVTEQINNSSENSTNIDAEDFNESSQKQKTAKQFEENGDCKNSFNDDSNIDAEINDKNSRELKTPEECLESVAPAHTDLEPVKSSPADGSISSETKNHGKDLQKQKTTETSLSTSVQRKTTSLVTADHTEHIKLSSDDATGIDTADVRKISGKQKKLNITLPTSMGCEVGKVRKSVKVSRTQLEHVGRLHSDRGIAFSTDAKKHEKPSTKRKKTKTSLSLGASVGSETRRITRSALAAHTEQAKHYLGDGCVTLSSNVENRDKAPREPKNVAVMLNHVQFEASKVLKSADVARNEQDIKTSVDESIALSNDAKKKALKAEQSLSASMRRESRITRSVTAVRTAEFKKPPNDGGIPGYPAKYHRTSRTAKKAKLSHPTSMRYKTREMNRRVVASANQQVNNSWGNASKAFSNDANECDEACKRKSVRAAQSDLKQIKNFAVDRNVAPSNDAEKNAMTLRKRKITWGSLVQCATPKISRSVAALHTQLKPVETSSGDGAEAFSNGSKQKTAVLSVPTHVHCTTLKTTRAATAARAKQITNFPNGHVSIAFSNDAESQNKNSRKYKTAKQLLSTSEVKSEAPRVTRSVIAARSKHIPMNGGATPSIDDKFAKDVIEKDCHSSSIQPNDEATVPSVTLRGVKRNPKKNSSTCANERNIDLRREVNLNMQNNDHETKSKYDHLKPKVESFKKNTKIGRDLNAGTFHEPKNVNPKKKGICDHSIPTGAIVDPGTSDRPESIDSRIKAKQHLLIQKEKTSKSGSILNPLGSHEPKNIRPKKKTKNSKKTTIRNSTKTRIPKTNFKRKGMSRLESVEFKLAFTYKNTKTCKVCHKRFREPIDLLKHLSTHAESRPFSCPDCGKNFKRKTDVEYHMFTHTGKKPFTCPLCKKSYNRFSTLNRHKANIHNICS